MAEHAHWLRDRRAACLRFLQQATKTLLKLDEVETRVDAVRADRDASTRARHDLHDSTRDVLYGGTAEDMAALDNTVAHIRLMVPALVTAATDLQKSVQTYVQALYDYMTHRLVPESVPQYEPLDMEAWNHSRNELSDQLQGFTDAANAVLAELPRAAVRQLDLWSRRRARQAPRTRAGAVVLQPRDPTSRINKVVRA
ncbi:hypothetical protein ACFYPC_11095 [Streptomyces sp. NPDC005808]|uniref:hypothetical protein n=1 Tax=Streptomyces sp. NPDC005808 TaxID=3364734 RepID=UPI0036797CBE